MHVKPIYSLGCGDRFGRAGEAQLAAYVEASRQGVLVYPVWNKSHREHTTVHTKPASVRAEAEAAVARLGWEQPWFVDADHINFANMDSFIEPSDFFTIDVTHCIGMTAEREDTDDFVSKYQSYTGEIHLEGIEDVLCLTIEDMRATAGKYLNAVKEAGRIYRHLALSKQGDFQVEVSIDETDDPQTPLELFVILAMIANEEIPVDTIAPKFSGRFNKGVDYVGDVAQFEKEFEQDIVILKYAGKHFGLKDGLRLSVHSGSDKFGLYPGMNRIIRKHGVGLHVKTAGTTWLEEVIGLAEAGGSGLATARKIYTAALGRYDELAAPYATVIDINPEQLPSVETVDAWSSEEFVNALRHVQSCPDYNPSFRQLLHVAYKVAHELGDEYLSALDEHRNIVARNVTENLLKRHLLPLFGGVSTAECVAPDESDRDAMKVAES
ncbi:MAG: tagaturonate epimerase family protein [Pseudohongiellaceae bacterium]